MTSADFAITSVPIERSAPESTSIYQYIQQYSFIIILALAGVILLFIAIAVLVLVICMGWCCCRKCRRKKAPTRIRSAEFQMYGMNRLSNDSYRGIGKDFDVGSHCYAETNMTLIRNTDPEPTYAHINEVMLARNRRDAEPHDYEIYEVMTPIGTKKEVFPGVSCVRDLITPYNP